MSGSSILPRNLSAEARQAIEGNFMSALIMAGIAIQTSEKFYDMRYHLPILKESVVFIRTLNALFSSMPASVARQASVMELRRHIVARRDQINHLIDAIELAQTFIRAAEAEGYLPTSSVVTYAGAPVVEVVSLSASGPFYGRHIEQKADGSEADPRPPALERADELLPDSHLS